MKINVDPNAKASGFGYAEAGQYKLRVVNCSYMEGKNYPYLKWEFEFADPNVQSTDDSKPGHVFENTTLKNEGENPQFRLKQVCDALGLPWGEFDTEDTKGIEFDTVLKIHQYNGKFSNEVDQFIPVTA